MQVLTQSRRELIETTFDSVDGVHRAIVHVYNAISPAWRRIVFGMDKAQIKQIAVDGVSILREQAEARTARGTDWRFEYSAGNLLHRRGQVQPGGVRGGARRPGADARQKPVILNLPATVECATPNVYADQIEWFCRHLSRRDSVVISAHPHNDRGTGVAAAEFAVMAGADRVEGCLFGNGERTGNVDLVTLALNLYTQGVDPGLDFSDLEEVKKAVEYCNDLPVHPRHPVCGRPCLHRLLRLPPGRDQEGLRRPRRAQRPSVGRAVRSDRPGRHRLQLRGGDPGEQPVRQGRRRLGAGAGQGA